MGKLIPIFASNFQGVVGAPLYLRGGLDTDFTVYSHSMRLILQPCNLLFIFYR